MKKKERRRNGCCTYPGRDSTLLHCKGDVLVMPKAAILASVRCPSASHILNGFLYVEVVVFTAHEGIGRMDNCEINNLYGGHTAVAFAGNFEHAWAKPVYDSTNRTLQPYHIAIAPLSSLTAHSQILWPSMLIKPAIYLNLSPSRLPNLQLEPAPNSSTNQKSSATVGAGCQPLLPNLRTLRPKTAKQSREVSPQVVSGKSVLIVGVAGLTLSFSSP